MGQSQTKGNSTDIKLKILLDLLQRQKTLCKEIKTIKTAKEMNVLINNLQGYFQIECTVKKMLKDLKLQKGRDGLRIGNESLRNIFTPLATLSAGDNGVAVSTGFMGSDPFAVMKISTGSRDEFYQNQNLHEIIIGLLLNSIREDTPCFTYCYGGFYCSPPMDMERYWKANENRIYFDLLSKLKTGDDDLDDEIVMLTRQMLKEEISIEDFLNGYQNLLPLLKDKLERMDLSKLREEIEEARYSYPVIQKDLLCINSKSDEVSSLSLFEFVGDSVSLISFLNNLEISDAEKIQVLQMVYISLYIAYKKFHFIHNDLHGGNILVQNLGEMKKIQFNVDGKIFSINTRYLPKIIDYGLSIFEYQERVINSPQKEVKVDKIKERDFYKDIEMFLERLKFFSNYNIIPSQLDIIKKWNYKYLVGPITISEHYSKKFNKHIYIMGDQHDKNNTKCPEDATYLNSINVADYLYLLPSVNDNLTLDYFIESPFLSNKLELIKREAVGFIGDIEERFVNCYKIDKQGCEFKNLRYHYSDIRAYPILWNFALVSILVNVIVLFGNLNPETPLIGLEPVSEIFSQINWSLLFENWSNFLELVKKQTKIEKQIMNIENKEIIDSLIEIENTIRESFSSLDVEIIKRIKKSVENGGSFNKLKDLYRNMSLARIQSKILFIGMKIFDLYLLGRMFRKWSGTSSSNIIIYVGDNHAESYRKILKDLGFETLNQAESEEKDVSYQCIKIENFKQPFFS